jgi:hypothetical protein
MEQVNEIRELSDDQIEQVSGGNKNNSTAAQQAFVRFREAANKQIQELNEISENLR